MRDPALRAGQNAAEFTALRDRAPRAQLPAYKLHHPS